VEANEDRETIDAKETKEVKEAKEAKMVNKNKEGKEGKEKKEGKETTPIKVSAPASRYHTPNKGRPMLINEYLNARLTSATKEATPLDAKTNTPGKSKCKSSDKNISQTVSKNKIKDFESRSMISDWNSEVGSPAVSEQSQQENITIGKSCKAVSSYGGRRTRYK